MKYPGALLKNDLQYFRPNLEGFLITYRVPKYQQQLWLDWTSKQSEIDREGFIIGFAGKYKPSSFYVSHHFTLWHNALTSVENADEHIRDNGAFTASIGYDASRLTFLDSLDVQLGGLISMDRLRNVYKWRTPKGVLLGAYLAYQAFFIKETWYIGDSQEIGFGDPFYQFKNYNRLDLGWKAFQSKNLEASVGTSFHFAKGAMLNQQQLSLRYSIGGNIPIHSLNKGSAMNHF